MRGEAGKKEDIPHGKRRGWLRNRPGDFSRGMLALWVKAKRIAEGFAEGLKLSDQKMFSVDNDQNPNDAISCDGVVQGTLCGPTLGSTLISLFGFVPEAFKAKPLVYTQCPDPGLPAGTCTMHSSRLDLAPALAALGLVPPPTANIFTPSPNHSHVVNSDAVNVKPIWWQVIPVLVNKQNDWPSKEGTSGITSEEALTAAENRGDAVQVPSNFFLFFSSYTTKTHMHQR